MTSGRLTATAFAQSAIATRDDPYAALNEALAAVRGAQPADLVLLFVNSRFARFLPALVARVRDQLHPGALAGCTSSGVIGGGEEREQSPAIALVAMRLPGATITTMRLGEWLHDAGDDPDLWRSALDLPASAVNGLLLIADPFRTDTQSFTMGLHRAYPQAAIAGAVTSGSFHQRQSWIVCDDDVGVLGVCPGRSKFQKSNGLWLSGAWSPPPEVSGSAEDAMVIDRFSADTMPSVTVPASPSGAPIAIAVSPTLSWDESANSAGWRLLVSASWMTARSEIGSMPTMVAAMRRPSLVWTWIVGSDAAPSSVTT